jgi:uncharacterized protein YjbI with pentapeptide repeats
MQELLTKEEWFEIITTQGVQAFNAQRRAIGYEFLDLSDMDFTGKDLEGINFSNTGLQRCRFDFAYLAEASLIMCEMQQVSCRETSFFQASLEESIITMADLNGAIFDSASLMEANLTGSDAQNASFIDADLSNANFSKTQLNDANLSGANCCGTSFKDARMPWAILDGIQSDEKTIWSSLQDDAMAPEDEYDDTTAEALVRED